MNPAVQARASAPPLPVLWRSLLAGLMLAVAGMAAWVVQQHFERQDDQAEARLVALAELRTTQLEAWLAQWMGQARYLSTSEPLAEQFRNWTERGDQEDGRRLMARLVELRRANDADDLLLLSADGQLLARERPADAPLAAELLATVRRAVDTAAPALSSIYGHADPALPLRLDIAVPLLATGTPPRCVVVLRVDPRRVLFPMLSAWPVPSATGESVLWRPVGDRLLALSDLRSPPAGAARPLSLPLAQSELAAARVLRGEASADQVIEATDYRGQPVLATGRPVQGSDWWLVAKVDQAEVQAPAWRHAQVVGAAALLAMLGLVLGGRLWWQRQTLLQVQQQAQDQRERLNALGLLDAIARSSQDAIFAKDLQGRYTFYNAAAGRQLGRDAASVLGRTDAELFDAATAARLVATDRAVLDTGSPQVLEERLPDRDADAPDATRVMLCAKGVLFDAAGQPMGVYGVSRDMTDLRRAERQMREREAHYRSVVSVLSEGVLLLDARGRLLLCNPAAEAITGVSQAQWQQRGDGLLASGWTVLRDDGSSMPAAETPPGRVLAGGPAQEDVVLACRRPDGSPAWLAVSAAPVLDPASGALLAVACSFTDITARRQADNELARHREQLEELVAERTAALQSAHDSLARADRFIRTVADNLPGRVAYWDAAHRLRYGNQEFFRWYGLQPEAVLGQTLELIFAERGDALSLQRLLAALDGTPQRFERETQRADGSRPVHQLHYIPDRGDNPGGPVQGVFVMAFDISALKRAEADLRALNSDLAQARDAAEAANRAKSAFLANMSHEIRTPMNAIIGLTHLIARDTPDGTQRERLGKVDDAARHLLQVINDILDLSKIEAGKMLLDDTVFSLDNLLARSFEMVRGRAADKGLELVLDTDHLPARLRGDPTRLAQALINLLSNAVKFTDTGWVRLRGELLQVQGERQQVRFEVADTGVGIAPAQQSQLFNAFEQADSSATRRHGGTGLGLALSRHLVRLMGGEIDLHSAPGVGSRFWFTAWLGVADAAGPSALPVRLQGQRALVVDDLPEARAALADRLGMLGLQVESAGSGAEALQMAAGALAAGHAPDLLLVDWRMAPMDGIETLRRLQVMLGAAMPPSVLVTAHDDAQLWRLARSVGCASVLQKPLTPSVLHDTLVQVLSDPMPAAAQAQPARERPGAAEALLRSRHAGQRVLLVEDNPVNQEVAAHLLRLAGLQVQTAADGADAVAAVQQHGFDLVLMDMQMPVMDGLQATRAIRRQMGNSLPIIAMTANAFGEDRDACLGAGMNDHVAKPVDPERLFGTLLQWLPAPAAGLPRLLPAAPGGEGVPGVAGVPAAARPDGQQAEPPAAGAAAMEHALTWQLAAVPGFDPAGALQNLGGRWPVLVQVLQGFAAAYRSGDAALAAATDLALQGLLQQAGLPGSAARLRAACHSLRGACATVGAVALQRRFQAIESAADQDGAVPGLHAELQALQADLQTLAQRLGDALRLAATTSHHAAP